ncbi:MAG: nucleotidyl transferase AbiEii/AbiGii toxin family protein [Nitrososphaerales archaeon]
MHRIPDRKYFQAKSADTRFRAPELEKVYRLMLILSEINRGTLNRYLALRGGTAINLCFTKQLPRLSIDIDLVLARDGDRETMLRDREFVRKQLLGIFKSAGYATDSYLNYYALDQFDLKYVNAFGGRDRVKAEINYLASRVPIYPIAKSKLHNIFDIDLESVRTLSRLEIYGSKIEALIKRNAPRDLFDVFYLAHNGRMSSEDTSKLRKCTIFSCCVEMNSDFRKSLSSNPADAIDAKRVNNELIPYVREGYNFNLASAKSTVGIFCKRLFKLRTNEEKFLREFFDYRQYKPKFLFPNQEYLVEHPGIKWRLQQMPSNSAKLGGPSA